MVEEWRWGILPREVFASPFFFLKKPEERNRVTASFQTVLFLSKNVTETNIFCISRLVEWRGFHVIMEIRRYERNEKSENLYFM